MVANVGNIDRILRLVLGAVLIALPFLTDFPLWQTPLARFGVPAVGAVLVLTAAFRFCPLYRLIGVKTCRV
jgi:uncharacterized membrane protein YphA (DoxX/SURF4 family)